MSEQIATIPPIEAYALRGQNENLEIIDARSPGEYRSGHIEGAISSVLLLAGLWWILSNGSLQSWIIGLPALFVAAWAGNYLSGSARIRISPLGAVRFVPFFLWQSLRGGMDVALRTLAPRVRVRPDFYRYRCGLQTPSARTFFAYCVCLLPGTLTTDLQGAWLGIHSLNTASEPLAELARLERVIAGLFAEPGGTQ